MDKNIEKSDDWGSLREGIHMVDEQIGGRSKILIVDDSEMNRSILADMLGDEFEIIEAADGVQAIAMLQRLQNEISLVLLDIVMPQMDGFAVLTVMKQQHWLEDVPVIMISAENTSSYVEKAYEMGVTDYISRPFDALVVHRRVVNTIMLYAKQKKLVGMVADQIYEKEKSNRLLISILSHIVEFRNGESGLHVLHIQNITQLLLRQLMQMTDQYHLSSEDISLISTAAALHDIGKIAIPSEILNKPGRLTAEEFEIMKTHSTIGASMLEQLPLREEEPLVKIAYQICRWHHERYDGCGYPDKLQGEEIPIAAQIVALADVYDALTSERVYKKAFSHDEAIRMILHGECGAFNSLLLDCLRAVAEQMQAELDGEFYIQKNQKEIGKITKDMLYYKELSASERTLRLLEHERNKYRFFASMSNEIQFEYTANPSMVTISDWGAAQLKLPEIILEPEQDEAVRDVFSVENMEGISAALRQTTPEQPIIQYDCRMALNGAFRWVRMICRATWSAEEPAQYMGALGKVVDIHEERQRLLDLEYRASHDGLTGLANAAYAKERITEQLQRQPEKQFVLCIFDLNFFKSVNDIYGHVFGDDVLQYVAERLRHDLGDLGFAARVGGDEFLLFLEYPEHLKELLQRIFNTLTCQYKGFSLSISMGVACTDVVEPTYEALFRCADLALCMVKRKARGTYCIYEEQLQELGLHENSSGQETVQ